MFTFRLFLLTSFALLINAQLWACKGPCLKVIHATSQDWVAGIKNGGRGTNYVIKCVVTQSSDKLKIDRLWIGDQFYPVKPVRSLETIGEDKFAAGDTIYLQASRFISTREPATEVKVDSSAKEPIPYKYKGAALIGYSCGKKMKYVPVPEFKKLEKLNMP